MAKKITGSTAASLKKGRGRPAARKSAKAKPSPRTDGEVHPKGKSCLGALSDQAALEFRQCAEHVKNEPPLRGRRVESFGQATKPDISQPQFLDGFDQLLHRPRQAVELPDNNGVATPREFERVVKGWAIRDRSRNLLGENLPASRLGQRVPLQGQVLVDGRNPRIADQHALRMDFPVRPWRRFCLRAFPSGGASSSLL